MITKIAYDFCKEAGIFSGITNRFGNMLMGHGAIAGNPVQNAINKAISSGRSAAKIPMAGNTMSVAAQRGMNLGRHPILNRIIPQPVKNMMANGVRGMARGYIQRMPQAQRDALWNKVVQKANSRGYSQQQLDAVRNMFFAA